MASGVSGNNNTASGIYVLSSLTSGTGNTGYGANALQYITSQNYNTAFGYLAGRYYVGCCTYALTNAIQSTFIGALTFAAANGDTSENVFGFGVTGNGSHTTTLGDSSQTGLYFYGTVNQNAAAVTINRSDVAFGYVGTPGATALLGSFMPQNSETITVAAGCTNCEASTSTAPTGSADLYNINVCTAGQGTCSTKCVVNIAASTGAVTYTSCSSSFSVSGGGSINITAAGTPTGVNPVFTIAGTHN